VFTCWAIVRSPSDVASREEARDWSWSTISCVTFSRRDWMVELVVEERLSAWLIVMIVLE